MKKQLPASPFNQNFKYSKIILSFQYALQIYNSSLKLYIGWKIVSNNWPKSIKMYNITLLFGT